MRFDVVGYSDKGPRALNEDSWGHQKITDSEISLCIADGVGGNPCGQVASKLCTDLFNSLLQQNPTRDLFGLPFIINQKIKEYAEVNTQCSGMASTLSGCILTSGKLTGVHVGDTRIFVLRGNGIKQLTYDHTEVNRLVQQQKLHPADAKHYPRRSLLDMALGSDNPLMPQLFDFNLVEKDRILLTTDGVHTILKKRILRDLSITADTIDDFSQKIINLLSESKLKDNTTFVLAQVA